MSLAGLNSPPRSAALALRSHLVLQVDECIL